MLLPLFFFLTPKGLFFEPLSLGFCTLPFGCLCGEPLKFCFFRRVLLVLLGLTASGTLVTIGTGCGAAAPRVQTVWRRRAIALSPLER